MDDDLRDALESFYGGLHAKKGKPNAANSLSCIKPKLSYALGVHESRVEFARADAKRKGVPTDFTPDGKAIITSRSHQKAYLKAYRMRNNDAGYND